MQSDHIRPDMILVRVRLEPLTAEISLSPNICFSKTFLHLTSRARSIAVGGGVFKPSSKNLKRPSLTQNVHKSL